MADAEGGRNGPTNRDVATDLATELVKQLVISNEIGKDTQSLLVEMREQLEELNSNFEVVGRAMDILHEARGKKLGLADFAKAWIEAEEEVFGEDEEPGEGDPLVGAER